MKKPFESGAHSRSLCGLLKTSWISRAGLPGWVILKIGAAVLVEHFDRGFLVRGGHGHGMATGPAVSCEARRFLDPVGLARKSRRWE
jgi:hypothetical protein